MLHIVKPRAKARVLKALAKPDRPPFQAAQVLRPDPTDLRREENRRTHWTAVASVGYILRQPVTDSFGVLPPAYLTKAADLIACGRQHPVARFPAELREGMGIWERADAAAAKDPKLPACIHIVARLPGADLAACRDLVTDYLDEFFVPRGMVCEWAIHALRGDDGGWDVSPHAHFIVTTLGYRQDKRPGKRHKAWLATADQIAAAEAEWLRRTGLKPAIYTV